jgi:HD superfamily phosphodiesterase
MKGSKDPQHEWKHARRVGKNCRTIIQSLNLDNKVDNNLLQAACYLHDINRVYYPPGFINYFFETRNSKKILPEILSTLGLKESEKTTIENAIYSSSFSFPFKKLNKDKDLYTQILQDADTLDFFNKDRVKSFEKSKGKYFFYKIVGALSNWAVKYGRRNIKNYLNFPELAEKTNVQKSYM